MRGVALAVVLAVGASCNSLLGIEDLTLVDATPIDARATYVVREGTSGYALTKDTYITDAAPTASHADDADIRWAMTNNIHGLLRFDDLFGAGGIPPGATIRSATLELEVVEAGSASGKLHEAAVDWDEATTYNTLGAIVGVTTEDRGLLLGTIDGSMLGKTTVNVTSSLQSWTMNPALNKGWILNPSTTDALLVRIASSDDADEAKRPTLVVEIVP